MQLKARSLHLPDLKTSLSQAERYGHHLDKIQPAAISTGTPIQMLSASEEEQNKLRRVKVRFSFGTKIRYNDLTVIVIKAALRDRDRSFSSVVLRYR
jgi:hypothetical protein